MPTSHSEQQHSPEPWEYRTLQGLVYDAHGCLVTEPNECQDEYLGEIGNMARLDANGERIAACVNACAGLPTEALRHWATDFVGGGTREVVYQVAALGDTMMVYRRSEASGTLEMLCLRRDDVPTLVEILQQYVKEQTDG